MRQAEESSDATPAAQPPEVVQISPPTEEGERLWVRLGRIAAELGEDEGWVLVGGLMVQLLAYENGARSRPTTDIDLLANARTLPSMTNQVAETLKRLGAEMAMPPATDLRLGYQFELDGETIEVLGPDGLRSDPKTLENYESIQIDGGTQALQRAEKVSVSIAGGDPVTIRRPTLLGAILLKARALDRVRAKEAEHRQDLIRLLSFVDDPRGLVAAGGLTKKQKKWLHRIEGDLRWEEPEVRSLFDREILDRARAAYELLIA